MTVLIDAKVSEELDVLRKAAASFAESRSDTCGIRAVREQTDGSSRELWREVCELGWVEVAFPSRADGYAHGLSALGVVVDQLGRHLIPAPVVSTVLAGSCLVEGSGAAADVLERACSGETVLALASSEWARGGTPEIHVVAAGSGYELSGVAGFVSDGIAADTLVVAARDDGGHRVLVLLDPARNGVSRSAVRLMDASVVARVELDTVTVSRDEVVAEGPAAEALLERALERGAAVLAAEMLGGACAVFEATRTHLREREQFGARLSSFQALRHRFARMYVSIGLARSVVEDSLRAQDADSGDRSESASTAKALAGDCYLAVTREGLQMHGGLGMTDECDVGLHLKRARVSALRLGGSGFHRARLADLGGY